MKVSSRFFLRLGSVSDVCQVFHTNHANTVDECMVDDLTADFVVVVFHPSRFFIFGLTDRIQFLGFPKFAASSSETSTYISTLITFKEKGFGSDCYYRQITESEVNAHDPFTLG